MPKGEKIALALLFTLLIFFFAFYAMVVFEPFKTKEPITVNSPVNATLSQPTISFVDPKRGNAHGKIMLVEFGDYQCPYCQANEATLNAALIALPDVVLVWKDLPNTTLHKESTNAALAARCAGKQGKFWEYHDLLFQNQANLASTLYPQLAQQLNLDTTKFAACITNQDERPIIDRNVEEAMALGVDGTPYFFLGTARISGAITPQEFMQILKVAQDTVSNQK